VKYPLASLGYETKYDVIVRAEGGGLSAQAQAILLGVARALIVANQANRDPLKKKSC
jgi:small subunit ribosomal protein S9